MSRPLPADQQAASFCDHYAKLRAVVTEANRYGHTIGLEHAYATERGWMLQNYRHVKRQLTRCLQPQPKIASAWSPPLDSFEKLFNSPTLSQLLNQEEAALKALLDATKSAVEKTFKTPSNHNPKLVNS